MAAENCWCLSVQPKFIRKVQRDERGGFVFIIEFAIVVAVPITGFATIVTWQRADVSFFEMVEVQIRSCVIVVVFIDCVRPCVAVERVCDSLAVPKVVVIPWVG